MYLKKIKDKVIILGLPWLEINAIYRILKTYFQTLMPELVSVWYNTFLPTQKTKHLNPTPTQSPK